MDVVWVIFLNFILLLNLKFALYEQYTKNRELT